MELLVVALDADGIEVTGRLLQLGDASGFVCQHLLGHDGRDVAGMQRVAEVTRRCGQGDGGTGRTSRGGESGGGGQEHDTPSREGFSHVDSPSKKRTKNETSDTSYSRERLVPYKNIAHKTKNKTPTQIVIKHPIIKKSRIQNDKNWRQNEAHKKKDPNGTDVQRGSFS